MDKSELSQKEWREIYKLLTIYAYWKAKKLLSSEYNFHQGYSPEDIAHQAIESYFDQSRIWNREKYPDIKNFLFGIIDSLISHLRDSNESRKKVDLVHELERSGKFEDEDLKDQALNHPLDAFLLIPGQTITPETLLISEEDRMTAVKSIQRIRDYIRGDDELEKVMHCFEKGYYDADTIVARTGIPKKRIYELRRKLKDKANQTRDITQNLETAEEK